MERYGVTCLALFGSTVCNAARSDSDIAILVAFDGPATSDAAQRAWRFYLDDMIGFAEKVIASPDCFLVVGEPTTYTQW